MKIEVQPNKYLIIDAEDLDHYKKYNWFIDTHGYVCVQKWLPQDKKYKKFYLHREIMGNPKGKFIDHKNGNKMDNRRTNLRVCTTSQNAQNMMIPKNNTSGFKGVVKHKLCDKWVAQIKIMSKHHYLGLYSTKEEAAHIYNQFAEQLFGEFARLNDV